MAKKVSSRPSVRKAVNLPRHGIFLAREAKLAEIPWMHPKTPDTRPEGPIDDTFFFKCFLCDTPLSNVRDTSNEDTHEHVFAQWMQDYFGIADVPTSASDPNSITYDDLRIPACARCNNAYLSAFEDRIGKALKSGFDDLAKLRKCDVFLWCAKIYYALVHNMVVPRDWATRKPLEPQLPKEFLSDLVFLRVLLQGFRRRVLILGSVVAPYSVLLFRLHSGHDPGYFFRVMPTTRFPGIALQLGSIGIVVVCDDYGECELAYDAVFARSLAQKTLVPIQFWELAGRLLYRASTVPVATSWSVVLGEADMTLWLTAQPEQYSPMDPAEEASWISQFTKEPPEQFWNAERQTGVSYLIKPDWTFNELEFFDTSPPRGSASR